MEIRYRINRHAWREPLIQRVEIERETAEYVFLPPGGGWRARRERKDRDYFPTFAEAKAELVARRERDLRDADDARSRAISALKEARELSETPAEGGSE